MSVCAEFQHALVVVFLAVPYLTKEIVSKFRRSHSPAHSKKSPPYSILEGASAVSSWANLLRKCE